MRPVHLMWPNDSLRRVASISGKALALLKALTQG